MNISKKTQLMISRTTLLNTALLIFVAGLFLLSCLIYLIVDGL